MPPIETIIQNVAAALESRGAFRDVTTRPPDSTGSPAVPRAHVVYDGHDVLLPDDSPTSLWGRVRLRVVVQARGNGGAGREARARELAGEAEAALLADPLRGGTCRDLPIGPATEIGGWSPVRDVRPPFARLALSVRCHFEMEDAR